MSHSHHTTPPHHSKSWQPHRDWRVIVGAIIMLFAMVIYVMTMDESIVPGDTPGSEIAVPAMTTDAP